MVLTVFRVRHRGRRAPLVAIEVARLLRPTPAPAAADLGALFQTIWTRHGDKLWSVSELRALGYVPPDQCRALGYSLSAAVRAGGRVGRFELHRVGEDRGGAIYRLEVVTCGDSTRRARKNGPSPFAGPRR